MLQRCLILQRGIELIGDEHTIWVKEKLLSTTDLSDKKTALKKYTDNIDDCDESLSLS